MYTRILRRLMTTAINNGHCMPDGGTTTTGHCY